MVIPRAPPFPLELPGKKADSLCGRWLHDGIFYPTTADFRHAWTNGKIAKTIRNAGMNETWIGTDREGAELPYDNRPPPLQIATGGQRFAIDENAQYVEWMELVLPLAITPSASLTSLFASFSFYWSFRRDSGMRLWNIKYQNQTVLYELGLNEALAHCEFLASIAAQSPFFGAFSRSVGHPLTARAIDAGNDPVQSGTAYLDTCVPLLPSGSVESRSSAQSA